MDEMVNRRVERERLRLEKRLKELGREAYELEEKKHRLNKKNRNIEHIKRLYKKK
jgi:hypothetical protein